MLSFSNKLLLIAPFVFAFSVSVAAQATPSPTPVEDAKPTEKAAEKAKDPKDTSNPQGIYTAEQIVESAIVVYAFPGGRPLLERIRKTTAENGTTTVRNADGKNQTLNYKRWIIQGPSLEKDKRRLETEASGSKYSMIQNDGRVSLVVNDAIYSPRDDAAQSFKDQIYHGLDALLRYKENGSKLELAGKEKDMGVEYYLIDVTDNQSRKTRFYVSVKRFRVMMLDYEEGGKKFRRKFYDYNYAQGTLVPHRTTLYEDGKLIEDTEVGTITYGQKVEESLFPNPS